MAKVLIQAESQEQLEDILLKLNDAVSTYKRSESSAWV